MYFGGTLPETNSEFTVYPLKMHGWKTFSFPFGMAYFSGCYVVILLFWEEKPTI